MLKRKINAQKLVHFNFSPYLCIRKRNKNNLNPKTRKGNKIMKTFFKAIATEKGFEGEIISDSRSYMSPRYNVETRTFSKPEPMTREQFIEHVHNTDWKSFKVEEYSIN